jgi:hypothetical protein
MSEQLSQSPEHKSENLDLSAEIEKNLKRAEAEAEKSVAAEKADSSELRNKVEQQAVSGKEITVGEKQSTTRAPEFGAYAEMKGQAYKMTLGRIRQRLSAPERVMSKAMHNKVVDTASEVLGKTAARPSGILGGGIVALIGSSILLYMAKKYGFEYNFFIFFVLLATGFAIGLFAELLIRFVAKSKR